MIRMTHHQAKLHERAVACGRKHRGAEAALVLALQEVEGTCLYRLLDCPSLFSYAVRELGLTDSVAGMSIAVARKAATVPSLQRAISDGSMSVSLASRIVSCLSLENAEEVIAFALSHTCREADEECARRNPKRDARDRAKPTGNGRVELTATVSRETYEKIQRCRHWRPRPGANRDSNRHWRRRPRRTCRGATPCARRHGQTPRPIGARRKRLRRRNPVRTGINKLENGCL